MNKKPYISIFNKDSNKKFELIKFLKILFVDYSEDHWNWEFKNSHILTAEYNGKIIGHYAVLKLPFYCNNKLINGAKAEGSLVDLKALKGLPKGPERNVFLNLVKQYINSSNDINIGLTFGFPNSKALPGQIKAGYEVVKVKVTPRFMLLRSTRKIESIFSKGWISNIFSFLIDRAIQLFYIPRNVAFFPGVSDADKEKLKIFSAQVSKENPNVIFQGKTWEYIDWRFNKNPYTKNKIFTIRGNQNQIYGILILAVENQGPNCFGSIQDFAFTKKASRSDVKKIFKTGIHWLYNQKVQTIQFWQSDCRPFAAVTPSFSRLGFIIKKNISIREMIVHSNNNIDISSKNWYVTKAFKRY